MLCKPDYLYVNGFLEIRIISLPKKKDTGYPLVQKKIEYIGYPVVGVTKEGKYLHSGSKSRNDLLVELQKNFEIIRGTYFVTNLFDLCVYSEMNTIKYKNVIPNNTVIKAIDSNNGILLTTNNQRCLLTEVKHNDNFFSKINKLGNALCR